MTTGEKIRYYRQLKHLTQEELGRKCVKRQEGKPDTSIAGSTIRSYERGGLNPKPDTLKIIASALEVYWIDLLGDDVRGQSIVEPCGKCASRHMTQILYSMDSWQIKNWVAEQVERHQKCGGDIAGKIAEALIACVEDSKKARSLLALFQYYDIISDDIKAASFAVLKSGILSAIKKMGAEKGLDIYCNEDDWTINVDERTGPSGGTIHFFETPGDVISFVNNYKPIQIAEDQREFHEISNPVEDDS